ncbi:hypothetical protein LNKW23_20790 [Paralimibaculum aggregatum]|uniref:Uncharacterized protein n=1 Tax=Paralimibaculum aggregatum TaxID=3036245 RepID=A0ABQ6LQD0_9RHOB|nr:hypothetical protein [Limibaculum sp. NKW23]GMG82866.1 hypothetical protein LNKW23_20790 [Limibaculum sp. NKW23]
MRAAAALLVLALAAGNCGGTPERASALLPPARAAELRAAAEARLDGPWGEAALAHFLSLDPADRAAVAATARRGHGAIGFAGTGPAAREAAAFAGLLVEAGWLAPATAIGADGAARPVWLLTAEGDVAMPGLLRRAGIDRAH